MMCTRILLHVWPSRTVNIESLRAGRRGSVARAITMVENHVEGAADLLRTIYPETGNSDIVGVTGPAGAGKSSLIDGLAQEMAGAGAKPAVLAIDPTSHVTGEPYWGTGSACPRPPTRAYTYGA